MKILLASKNKGKIAEFKEMVKDFPLEIKTLYDFEDFPDIEETGTTFKENALIKAKEGFERTNLLTIADDSGLEVDFLDGRPGVYSARYGGDGLDDLGRMNLLLEELKYTPKESRGANFTTSIVLYYGEDFIYEFTDRWDGEILFKAIGEKGFGYDPIFFDPTLNKSAAQLTHEEKSKVSHRGKAMKKFFKELPNIISKIDSK